MANGKKQYRSMRGTIIDMEAMTAGQENLPALNGGSDIRMNARGDLLNKFSEVQVSREQIVRDYYSANPNGVKQVSLKAALADTFETPAEAMARLAATEVKGQEVDTPLEVVGGKKARRLINKED